MKLNSSFISSSEPEHSYGSIALVVAMTALFIVVIDVFVNFVFTMPEDPRIKPNRLQQYFEYGRSLESKLQYLVRETNEISAPIANSGWLATEVEQGTPLDTGEGMRVAIYGQSMSNRVGYQLKEIDPEITLRLRGGPGAPINHSYTMFSMDEANWQHADVVVLSIVASGVRMLTTMTTMGWAFEVPAPYTYPRWRLVDGEAESVEPLINSLEELRTALEDPVKWDAFKAQLAEHDASFSPTLFNGGWSDRSALLRLARRGFGQRHQDRFDAPYLDRNGFKDHADVLEITRQLITKFADKTRAAGAKPVVILFHDQGTSDFLYAAVSKTLDENGIAYISTHEIAPSMETTSYLPDGHFKKKYDRIFAERIMEQIEDYRNPNRAP